ncbi:MAG: class A beta-lactamase-related serine hydrolase [Planctomycetes bacterium]|nr:class A beta-lactamase-related serine hydrolase [Planctomycetota bacterium]
MLPNLAALLVVLAPAAWLSPQDDLAPGELVEGELGYQLDDYLTRFERLGFAGVVGVEYEKKPILIRGYGLADRERGTPVTPETVFCTGSITKQFTAAAILALQDDGKLSVEDPLTKFFERVPEDKRGITLHHLLTHTSGLADPLAGDYDLGATAAWVRDQAFGCALQWRPGERYGYRNVNFSLLGMVIERVSGEGYEAFLQKRLFARAGMARTGYLLPRFAPESFAIGYQDGERWGTTLDHPLLADGPCWTLRANGGIQSTVGDMLRWHHALAEDRVLSRAAHAQLETPYADEGGGTFYGYGWSIQKSPSGKKLVAHNGGNGISFADFLRFVDEGHCIFVATNVASRVRESLAYDLAAILYGRPARALPETLARDRAALERYAGRYPLGEGSALEVLNLGDRLVLTGSGPDADELLYDETARTRMTQVRELFAALCRGDDTPFLAAYKGRQTSESIRAELAAARARWQEHLGTFRELGPAAARAGAESRVLSEARFERGNACLVTTWGPAGRLFAFECLDTAPFSGPPRVELFPVSSTEFRSYDDGEGLGQAVGFELDGERASALSLGAPPLVIARE